MATAKRELTFLLANPERRLLRHIAAHIPGRWTSNHLTALGVLGAMGTGMAYALSSVAVCWLWVANAMLVVNWFGDSLDGTLARVRHAERPRYGYYLDHIVDAFSTAAIGIGIGLSPFVSFPMSMGLVALYLILSINLYLESQVFGIFKLSYGIIGPTEARIILVVANTLLLALPETRGFPLELVAVAGDVVAAVLGLGMLVTLVLRFGKNLSKLAKLEPRRRAA